MEKNAENNISDTENKTVEENEVKEELTVEEKLEQTEEKLLRSLAEVENQRRRFEKEIKEALDYGGFNFAKEMISILDNLQRARISIKNDETLKSAVTPKYGGFRRSKLDTVAGLAKRIFLR